VPLYKGYKIFPPVTNSPESKPAVNVTNADSKEPAVATGATLSGLVGLLFVIDGFAPDLFSNDFMAWASLLIALLSPIITSFIIRRKVFSPATVLEAIQEGIDEANKAANNRRKI
jgi:hypothetical protein